MSGECAEAKRRVFALRSSGRVSDGRTEAKADCERHGNELLVVKQTQDVDKER